MRPRVVDPEFMLEDEVAATSIAARLLLSYLPCYADRDGRVSGTPMGMVMLKARLFPIDDLSVAALVDELIRAGLVARYVARANGKEILEIVNFSRIHRPHRTESVMYPGPEETAEEFNARQVGVHKSKLDRGRMWANRRREVLERDGFKCGSCGAGGKLDVHHKVPLRRFAGDLLSANAPDNLISLCRPCHNRADAEIRRAEQAQGGVA